MNRFTCTFFVAAIAAGAAHAATSLSAPQITVVSDKNYGGSLDRLSDNGLWAVGYGKSQLAENYYSFPRLYDVKNNEVKYLFTPAEETSVAIMTANDVTDDGSIVVGCYDDKPAIWRASTQAWEQVENKHEYKFGSIDRVTPDGHFAIGTVRLSDGMFSSMRVWDLSGSAAVDITPDNLPKPIGPNLTSTTGSLDSMVQQLYAGDISADGRFFTGMVNFSYPDDCWTFVYDMSSGSWSGVGMNVTENGDQYIFERNIEGVLYVNTGEFIGDSHRICGELYSEDDNSGVFFLDCDSMDFTVTADGAGYTGAVSDPLGTIYASKSFDGPMRDWYFKIGNYWYDFAVVLQQLWDVDWEQQYSHDGIGLTGTFTNVSNDGLTLVATDYSASPYNSYIISLPATLSEVVKDFNLLGNYFATPVNNSSFAFLREVKVTFDRNISVLGDYNAVSLIDENGDAVANSISLVVDAGSPNSMSAIFRNRRLEEGKRYTVVFPAGVVSVAGDDNYKNSEIRISYKGRPDAPVAPVSISPASGSEVSRINAIANPVAIRFNSEIDIVEGNENPINLYLVQDDDSRELITNLSGSISGDVLSVYPLLEQRLAYGSNYEIVVPAGIVADISGADPNEEFVIKYVGSYIPEGPGIDGVLFEDNFNEGLTNKWMFYDGAPEIEPSDLMASWGFEAGVPWWVVRDAETSTDQSAVSHSMFKSPDKADAWMVTSLLNIKDDTAVLNFKSQSYRNAGDHLKVYVYVTDEIYSSLTPSIVDKFRYYGELIYDEEQVPGENEELLAGDWRENSISLARFAGKNIYVAFVNDNRNKSAVFLDDVLIAMDMKFAVLNLTPSTVVDKTDIEIQGQLQVLSKTDSYKGYSIALFDAGDNKISELADANALASEGWKLDFKMPEALPLVVGKDNRYKLVVTVGDETETINASVRNLAIQTSKKVVIEEMTGQGCQFCPGGHAAIEWIQKDFPGLVLPVELHTYTGDNLNNDRVEAMCYNLRLQAAPTARVNRGEKVLSPLELDENGKYVYKNADTWYDHVVAELETMAPADIEVTSVSFDGSNCIADVTVTFAIDLENVNFNMLLELGEDDIRGFQTNYYFNTENQPALGEWGKGGIYGKQTVMYYYHNVLRNWDGNTFNGTGGLLPSTIQAGVPYTVQMKVAAPKSIADINKTHVTAMLIDSESGKILNADRRFTNTHSAVDTIDSDYYSFSVVGNSVNVSYPGDLSVEVYALDGMKLASANGSDSLSFNVANHSGMALILVRTADGIRHHKVLLR